MEEQRLVFITNKGKKYHFNPSCNYLKGKMINSIPYDKAKQSLAGPCNSCLKLLIENKEDTNSYNSYNSYANEDLKESVNNSSSHNKKNNEKKIKIKEQTNLDLNNFKNNLKFNPNEKIKIKNFEEEEDVIVYNNKEFKKNESNNIINKNTNHKQNDIPFMDNNLSSIIPNSDYYDMTNNDSSADSSKKKKKNNKKNKIKNSDELNFKPKEKKNDSYEENNINNENNFEEDEKEEKKINYNNNSQKKNSFYKEEENNITNNFIDSSEILDEPLNNIRNLQENISQKNKSYINYRINYDKDIFKIIKQTDLSGKVLYIKNLIKINDNQNRDILILSEGKINSNENTNLPRKGNYKFTFEITPIKNIVQPVKISVGFEIDYIDYGDINLINEDNENNYNNTDLKLGSLYETLVVLRHLNIYKKTNKVHILINIEEGLFFVIAKNELQNIDKIQFQNNNIDNILYLRRFNKIKLNQIKDVRPIFKYNKNDLKIVNIEIKGNKIDDNN